jgi:hypothetical protein
MRFRFLTDKELLTQKGIPGNESTKWRKRKQRKLPMPRKFGDRRNRSPEPLIDKYLDALAAGHTEEQATIIAETFLAALLAERDPATA